MAHPRAPRIRTIDLDHYQRERERYFNTTISQGDMHGYLDDARYFEPAGTDNGNGIWRSRHFPEMMVRIPTQGVMDAQDFLDQLTPVYSRWMRMEKQKDAAARSSFNVVFTPDEPDARALVEMGINPENILIDMVPGTTTLHSAENPEFRIVASYGHRNDIEDFQNKVRKQVNHYSREYKKYTDVKSRLTKAYGIDWRVEEDRTLAARSDLWGFEERIRPAQGTLGNDHPLTPRLLELEKKLAGLNAERMAKLKKLRESYFSYDLEKNASGALELVVSHPVTTWKQKRAALVGDKIGGDAAKLIDEAMQQAKRLKVAYDTILEEQSPVLDSAVMRHASLRAAPMQNFAQRVGETPKVQLVIDNSSIFLMETPRREGRKWLDLLRAAADASDRVVIPAEVAYWESMGSVPEIKKKENRVVQQIIDQSGKPEAQANYQALSEIYKTATHVILEHNGHVHEIPGSDPRFVIWHDPKQDAIFNHLRALKNEYKSKSELREALDKFRRTSSHMEGGKAVPGGANEGELAMLRYAQGAHSDGPIVLLTNDFRFLFSLGTRLAQKDLQTASGYGVGYTTTLGLIDSLNRAHGGRLHRQLGKFGAEEHDVHPRRIAHDFERFSGIHSEVHGGFEKVRDGFRADGTEEAPLEDAFRHALAQKRTLV